MDNNDFISGLSKSLIEATKQVLEGKKHTLPKTEAEKDLADLASPKGKITKKDILVGRGVVKEEEQIDELSKSTLASYVDKAATDVHNKGYRAGKKEGSGKGYDVDNLVSSIKRQSNIAKAAKKLAKEETQIDELSKGTLASYAKKAMHGQKEADRRATAYSDMAHDDMKRGEPEGAREFAKMAVKHITRSANRRAGVIRAIDKLAKEELEQNDVVAVYNEDYGLGHLLAVNEDTIEVMFEEGVVVVENESLVVEDVEDLNELSKDTLNSYTKKAQADPAFEKKKGKPSKATVAVRAKRTSGLEAAKAKLHAIAKKESEARAAEMAKHKANLGAHFEKEAPKILAKHGYKKVAEGIHGDEGYEKHVATYVKGHENGHVSTISIQKKQKPDSWSSGEHEVRAVNSKGTSYSSHQSHGMVWDKKDHDKHMTDMMPNFESHVIKVKNDTDNKSNW